MEIKGIVYSLEIVEFAVMASVSGISGLYGPAIVLSDIDREDVILHVHRMFRKDMLEKKEEDAVLKEPYQTFFRTLREAKTCVIVQAADTNVPSCCLYGEKDIVSLKSHFTGREKLTIQQLTESELPEYLVESGFCPEDITDMWSGETDTGTVIPADGSDESSDRFAEDGQPEETDAGGNRMDDREAGEADHGSGQTTEYSGISDSLPDESAASEDHADLLKKSTAEFLKSDGILMTADRTDMKTRKIAARFYIGLDETGLYIEHITPKQTVRYLYSHEALQNVLQRMYL